MLVFLSLLKLLSFFFKKNDFVVQVQKPIQTVGGAEIGK